GFSTAASVTSISGRGVGMDVVKKTIDDLRGAIDVSSIPGKGTRIDITLPLTLAIIDGLLVYIGNQAFIIPLMAVEECIALNATDRKEYGHRKLTPVRGTLIPYIELRERFGIQGKRPTIEQIVISRVRGERIGLVVDTVIGEHKTVIKPLGKIYRSNADCSGATVLGDGSIALILDTGRLVGTNPGSPTKDSKPFMEAF
ncbi:MAG TPA: chemotaxis protein CheW, partial [Candidatus Ozemobacteraceae bacterium]|nr:chemotaxis protein CheW [Candidatus Ozemobacteraceae bacterium]